MTFTKHDLTEDRVATLHSLLNDAAKKVGAQRQTIGELREALERIAGLTRHAAPISHEREIHVVAAAALSRTGAAQ